MDKGTTKIGYVNGKNQRVRLKTELRGSIANNYIYVLECLTCGHEYGANGCDIHERKCPSHDGGQPGLSY